MKRVLVHEDSLSNNPDDAGGATFNGIIQRSTLKGSRGTFIEPNEKARREAGLV
ncbi:MAG: glycosyl hydrolase 108 family protein [Afipia sp.]|nr:glycosyl hydrolase 108 family protein [Afipia sp.]